MAINKLLFIPQWHTIGTISTPDANYKSLYPKSNDSHWYFVDSDGSEKRIETAIDVRNGITTTTLATSSVFRARLDLSIGAGLTFSGNFAGSSVSVFGITTDMLNSVNSATYGYVLTSNGNSFNWITPSSLLPSISGTTNKISKFTSTSTIGDSLITDDGSKIVLGVTPSFALGLVNIDGNVYISGDIYLADSTNTYIGYSNGVILQTSQDIIFRDELNYNYLNLKTDNISSYTFSILEQTLLLGDNGSYSYLLANDINDVSFGSTFSTMTYSIFSDTPGVLRIKDTSEGINKVFVSDSQGYGRWRNLNAGSGLTVSGITYSIRLSGTGLTFSSGDLSFDYLIIGSTLTHSSGIINLNNSGVVAGIYGTSNQFVSLTVDTYGRITNINTFGSTMTSINTIIAGSGLTGGGSSSTVTIDMNIGNGLSFLSDSVILGGTLSQDTLINGNSYSIILETIVSSGITNSIILKDSTKGAIVLSSGDIENNTVETSFIAIQNGNMEIGSFDSLGIDSSTIVSSTNSIYIRSYKGSSSSTILISSDMSGMLVTDDISNKGLVYNDSYESNFSTYSLVTKAYVDNAVTLINPNSAGNGLTFSGGSYSVNVNSDSLEITSDALRLRDTISGVRTFTGGVTVSNNFSVTGSAKLIGFTASMGYISGTGSDVLTLRSTGTGSTIFRVQGNSGELFSIVDGLTGSLFSVNDISGLPILEVFSDETILMGDYAAPSLNTTTKVTSVTGSNTIYSISKSLYTGAFFEYTVTKGTNARAGMIMSVWNGLTASYLDTPTADIGSTSDIVFVVSATGSNAVLTASASTNNWVIKTIIRSI